MAWASSVLAVVDAVDGTPVVWWVDLGQRNPAMSRLCGAWVLDTDELRSALADLVTAHLVVATAAGSEALEERAVRPGRVVDPAATLAGIVDVRDGLQAAYEHAASTRKNGRALVAPSWPALPEPLDVESAAAPAGSEDAARALGIARWFNKLCDTWDLLEEQRLARSYLRPLGGDKARALPVALTEPAAVPA
jgi:hypothetical protein